MYGRDPWNVHEIRQCRKLNGLSALRMRLDQQALMGIDDVNQHVDEDLKLF